MYRGSQLQLGTQLTGWQAQVPVGVLLLCVIGNHTVDHIKPVDRASIKVI